MFHVKISDTTRSAESVNRVYDKLSTKYRMILILHVQLMYMDLGYGTQITMLSPAHKTGSSNRSTYMSFIHSVVKI